MTPLRVAVVARSVFPLHGHGGLERSVYDLVRYLAASRRRRDAHHPHARRARPAAGGDRSAHRPAVRAVSHLPLGRPPGDHRPRSQHRVSAVWRAGGAAAWELVERGAVDLVHGFGASVLGYARRRAARERAARPQSAGPGGIRRDRSLAGPAEAAGVSAASTRGPDVRARGGLRDRDRSRARARRPISSRRPAGARARHPKRARPAGRRRPGHAGRRRARAPRGGDRRRRGGSAERGPDRGEQGLSGARRRRWRRCAITPGGSPRAAGGG